VIDAHVKS